ncbi:MAG TPA: pyridoxal-phosphate dependent enzyme [Roseiarcus sp.]|nr:pyridoxal-phosphate dependent enzyme [Roseiarcus sp.]
MSASYIDPRSGVLYPLDAPRWRSDDGAPLLLTPGPALSRDDVARGERSLWRYRAALAGGIERPISMGEGCTPLIERPWGALRPLFKCEWFSPTGSFKDRGASVMLSFLRGIGIGAVLEDSSGNGGAAIAGYGAAGGLSVKVLAPAYTSPAKIAQVRAYGAEVELVEGPREASQAKAIRQSASIFYASHNWQPFFLEGTKTLAYELWEDLGFTAPDAVIVPVGAGSLLLGLHFGFGELLRAGQIARLPRLIAAQPLNCSPLAASFAAGVDVAIARETKPTVAEGTAIKAPLRLREMIAALRQSGGEAVAIPEADIVAALRRLAAIGLFVEPTSATAAAALDALAAAGRIGARERVVVVLSGSGLKAASTVADLCAS